MGRVFRAVHSDNKFSDRHFAVR